MMQDRVQLKDATVRSSAWSDREVQDLIRYWGEGESNDEIAALMKRNANAVAIKASRLKLPHKGTVQPIAPSGSGSLLYPQIITTAKPQGKIRACLCCRTQFFSEGAGNRICGDCKSSPAWTDNGEYSVRLGSR